MAIKDQWKTLKDNWLLVALALLLVLFSSFSSVFQPLGFTKAAGGYDGSYASSYASTIAAERGFYPPLPSPGDFAPDVEDRLITKTGNLDLEVPRGDFQEADQKLRSIVSSHKGFLLSEQAQKYSEGRQGYYSGSYTIKVDAGRYDAAVIQLKELGEIQSFSENAEDITGSVKSLETELQAEKQRLERYQKMLDEATLVSEKLELSDRIFNQERTIAYLEDALKNQGRQVEYATIYLQLNEKRSGYADLMLVTFSQLVSGFVGSLNGLLQLIVLALPYALLAGVVWWVWRKVKKSNK